MRLSEIVFYINTTLIITEKLNLKPKVTFFPIFYLHNINYPTIQQRVFQNITFFSCFRTCALLQVPRLCFYRMSVGEEETWYSISQICRNRVSVSLLLLNCYRYLSNQHFQIIAVCDFLNYLKYIQRGLVKSSGKYFNTSFLNLL